MTDQQGQVDVQKILSNKFEDTHGTYTAKDVILYALGVGFSRDPSDQAELSYTYENHQNFQVMPTFISVFEKVGRPMQNVQGLPPFNSNNVVHAEYYVEFLRPFKLDQTYLHRKRYVDVADKKKGTLVVLERVSYETDEDGKVGAPLCRVLSSTYIRKLGGFGEAGKNLMPALPKVPSLDAKPERVAEFATYPWQAILYRLCSDYNPLHIDPKSAQEVGFKRPILMGLCSSGIALRAVLREYCGYDSSRVKSLQMRYLSVVYPGETLRVHMWRENDRQNSIIILAIVKERNERCLLGRIVLNE